jgi:hypothetical protein
VLYGWKPGEDLKRPVQLECGSCHQPAAKGPGVNLADQPYGPGVAKRLDGAYMQPITYTNQCRACHPITDHLNNPLPHGLQPSELQKELTRALANSRTKVAASPGEKRRVVPGNPLSAEQARNETAEDQMRKAQRFLYLGRANCGECHYYEGPKDRVVPDKIIPPQLPTVWFQHALFNHKAHTDKKIDCRECHATAYTSKDHRDILVPGIENCKQCHAEGGKTTDGKTPRFDCTECHRYHHGDQAFMAFEGWRDRRPRRDTAQLLLEFAREKRRAMRP